MTICNCTLCRRYGVLWAYGVEGEDIQISGPTQSYMRDDLDEKCLEVLFCPNCACVLSWRALEAESDGKREMAVNLRLAPPEAVADLPLRRFDGLESFKALPRDGGCVRDAWF